MKIQIFAVTYSNQRAQDMWFRQLWANIYGQLNPRNFKIFILKSKLSFLRENHKNDNSDEFPDFYEFTLYMNFANFLKMTIQMMAIFDRNFKNHI